MYLLGLVTLQSRKNLKMNVTKTTVIASLLVLLLAMSSTASATYYYTSKNGTEITLGNETDVVIVLMVENASNETEAGETGANATEAMAHITPVEPVAEKLILLVTKDEAGSLVIDKKSGETPTGEGDASEDSTLAPTSAAVSGEGTSMQIAIITVSIVVIVAMFVVLLMRERTNEKGSSKKDKKNSKKDDWEEGSFFKEAKEKKIAKASKVVEIKAESNGKASQKKEIKPFLLKIKEEAQFSILV